MEHPSLTYMRLPLSNLVDSCEAVVKDLLASCPALRVIDFTEFGFDWRVRFHDDDVDWPTILRDIKEYVERDVYGADRLTHVFARRRDFNDHEWVVNLFEVEEEVEEEEEEEEEDLGGDEYWENADWGEY